MKLRLAVAVLCLAGAVLAACLVFCYVQRVCGALTQTAAGLLEDGLSDADVCAGARSLCERWEAQSDLFCVFVHHKDADELRQRFLRLRLEAEAGAREGVKQALEDCMISLRVIAEGEKPKLSNIF